MKTKTDDKKNNAVVSPSQYGLQSRKMPCFLYTAEISPHGFKAISCFGGFTSLTGYPEQKFFKEDLHENSWIARKESDSIRKFRKGLNSRSRSSSINYHIIARNGKKLPVSEHAIMVSKTRGKKLIAGIVMARGKTEKPRQAKIHSQLEKTMLRLEEMEKLNKHLLDINQLKDEFLANTSHELRTPLNSIIGFLTLVTEGYYDNEDELRLFTRNALDSSYHLLSVINDLLDISKIEAGKMQLQIERVYVEELINDICSLFAVQADQKGLELRSYTKGSPLFAAADLRKLKQVLINLVGNAIKFTSVGSVNIIVGLQNGDIHFAIKDTGIGIPKEKQDKLFQKFIQVDGGTTRKYGGTGLGLVISKHIVEMMGGRIRIESKGVGKGTTVHFTVPRWTKEVD